MITMMRCRTPDINRFCSSRGVCRDVLLISVGTSQNDIGSLSLHLSLIDFAPCSAVSSVAELHIALNFRFLRLEGKTANIIR